MSNENEHFLPAEEEIHMQDKIPYVHESPEYKKASSFYQYGWMKGRIYACKRIIEFVKRYNIPAKEFKEAIEFILDKKIWNK